MANMFTLWEWPIESRAVELSATPPERDDGLGVWGATSLKLLIQEVFAYAAEQGGACAIKLNAKYGVIGMIFVQNPVVIPPQGKALWITPALDVCFLYVPPVASKTASAAVRANVRRLREIVDQAETAYSTATGGQRFHAIKWTSDHHADVIGEYLDYCSAAVTDRGIPDINQYPMTKPGTEQHAAATAASFEVLKGELKRALLLPIAHLAASSKSLAAAANSASYMTAEPPLAPTHVPWYLDPRKASLVGTDLDREYPLARQLQVPFMWYLKLRLGYMRRHLPIHHGFNDPAVVRARSSHPFTPAVVDAIYRRAVPGLTCVASIAEALDQLVPSVFAPLPNCVSLRSFPEGLALPFFFLHVNDIDALRGCLEKLYKLYPALKTEKAPLHVWARMWLDERAEVRLFLSLASEMGVKTTFPMALALAALTSWNLDAFDAILLTVSDDLNGMYYEVSDIFCEHRPLARSYFYTIWFLRGHAESAGKLVRVLMDRLIPASDLGPCLSGFLDPVSDPELFMVLFEEFDSLRANAKMTKPTELAIAFAGQGFLDPAWLIADMGMMDGSWERLLLATHANPESRRAFISLVKEHYRGSDYRSLALMAIFDVDWAAWTPECGWSGLKLGAMYELWRELGLDTTETFSSAFLLLCTSYVGVDQILETASTEDICAAILFAMDSHFLLTPERKIGVVLARLIDPNSPFTARRNRILALLSGPPRMPHAPSPWILALASIVICALHEPAGSDQIAVLLAALGALFQLPCAPKSFPHNSPVIAYICTWLPMALIDNKAGLSNIASVVKILARFDINWFVARAMVESMHGGLSIHKRALKFPPAFLDAVMSVPGWREAAALIKGVPQTEDPTPQLLAHAAGREGRGAEVDDEALDQLIARLTLAAPPPAPAARPAVAAGATVPPAYFDAKMAPLPPTNFEAYDRENSVGSSQQ
ncbi:hypothetical protein H9P43_009257 [Blastocladiella emersonii ATCC 22665]|nr:hypothetical protein H9P43_009257 [Blastocladiella emersonii ATCC 22665]